MSKVAEAPSRNGNGSSDAGRYRLAVKARMKKKGSDGRLVPPRDAEVDQFLVECQVYQLEPLAGQIYAHWENGRMRAVTTIDGLRTLAERTGRYDGQNDPEWCDTDGTWTDYWNGDEEPLAARVRVHKKGTKVPTTGTANWHDFAPTGNEGADALWALRVGKPAHMLSIRAEALALRKAFPSELSGLYTAEELGISLAAIGAVGEEPNSSSDAPTNGPPSTSAPNVATPDSPAIPIPPSPPPGGGEDSPAVIVDAAAGQPSGAPARPQARRTLAEALGGPGHERLRTELAVALFDQLPDRLTDSQAESLASLLCSADAAGITAHELERICKVAMNEAKESVAARSEAIYSWIEERQHRADAAAPDDPGEGAAPRGGQPRADTPPSQDPSPLDADPGPEGRD